MTGWAVPDTNDELKKLHLDGLSGPYLLKVRANYIVQLIVSIASSTAVNLKPLFDALHPSSEKSKALLRKLRDLDQCLMSLDSMCSAWVASLNNILSHGDFVLHEVLNAANIKAATPMAIKLVKESGGGNNQGGVSGDGSVKDQSDTVDVDSGEKHNGPVVLSMKDLLTFGSTHIGLDSTESLLLLQLNVQQAIINHACRIEEKYRDMVSVVIQPPESEAKPARRGVGRSTCKTELLFKITDHSTIKQASFDTNLMLFRLPTDFGLVFGGTVGDLMKLFLNVHH